MTRLSAKMERSVNWDAICSPSNVPTIDSPPSSGGNAAAMRPRNTHSESRKRIGNAKSSARARSDCDLLRHLAARQARPAELDARIVADPLVEALGGGVLRVPVAPAEVHGQVRRPAVAGYQSRIAGAGEGERRGRRPGRRRGEPPPAHRRLARGAADRRAPVARARSRRAPSSFRPRAPACGGRPRSRTRGPRSCPSRPSWSRPPVRRRRRRAPRTAASRAGPAWAGR